MNNLYLNIEQLVIDIRNTINELGLEDKIPKSSWIYASISNTEICFKQIKKTGGWKYSGINHTSICNCYSIKKILDTIKLLDNTNKKVFYNKFKKNIFDAEFMSINENTNTNQGRNVLFELTLFNTFISRGYHPILSNNNEDISIEIGNNKYIIECKRPFKTNDFNNIYRNINIARKQINNRRKKTNFDYGIIALSTERFFNKGNKFLSFNSEVEARDFINRKMAELINKINSNIVKEPELKCLIRDYYLIPAIFFNFKDIALINSRPYVVDMLYLSSTRYNNNSMDIFNIIQNDFKKLIP